MFLTLVTTVYATLGEEAIPYAINQVAATTIVTSTTLLPKVATIARHCKSLKRVVYFTSANPEAEDPDLSDLNRQFDIVLSFDELIERGEDKSGWLFRL
jgi:long-subunit acyl-CoA synthetase (AMP-forming)